MKVIELAVTPLVQSILLSRYTEYPIKVNRSDALYYYLQGDLIRANETKFRKLGKELSKRVKVKVSDNLFNRLQFRERWVTVGYYLHKIYQQEMLIFMKAQHIAGVPAQTSLKEYFKINQVTEDDYALDSAYTVWKRKKRFLDQKIHVCKDKLDLHKWLKNEKPLPIDAREILRAANQYYECGMVNLIAKHIRIEKHGQQFTYHYDYEIGIRFRKARKVLAYLLHIDANLSGVDISKFINQVPRTIQGYIQTIRVHYDHYTDIQEDVSNIRSLYGR
ncbi:MAG: hypothetical protein MK212_19510 [Saprospiraceae bacterium]|nr:hypothetical protein [Saprospiraceae bacterium]